MSNQHQGISKALESAFCYTHIRLPGGQPRFVDAAIDEQFIDLRADRQLIISLRIHMKLDLMNKEANQYPFASEYRISIAEQGTFNSDRKVVHDNFSSELINTPEAIAAMQSAMKEYRSPLIAGISASPDWLNAASASLHSKFTELLGQSFANAKAVAKPASTRPAL